MAVEIDHSVNILVVILMASNKQILFSRSSKTNLSPSMLLNNSSAAVAVAAVVIGGTGIEFLHPPPPDPSALFCPIPSHLPEPQTPLPLPPDPQTPIPLSSGPPFIPHRPQVPVIRKMSRASQGTSLASDICHRAPAQISQTSGYRACRHQWFRSF